MILATICALISNIFLTIASRNGLILFNEQTIAHASNAMSALNNSNTCENLARWLARVSFGLWLIRLTTQKSTRIVIYVCIAITTIVEIPYAAYFGIKCRLVSATAVGLIESGLCWTKTSTWIVGWVQGGISVVLTSILCVMALLSVARLKVPKSVRNSCGALVGITFFAPIAAIVKIVLGRRIVKGLTVNTGVLVTFHIWTQIETITLIVVASVPTIRPLFLYFRSCCVKSATTLSTKLLNPMSDMDSDTIVATETVIGKVDVDSVQESIRSQEDRSIWFTKEVTVKDSKAKKKRSSRLSMNYLSVWTGHVTSPIYLGPQAGADEDIGCTITIKAGCKKHAVKK